MALELPTEPRQRTGSIQSARVLLIGPAKTGKTTLAAAWAPKETLILDTHGGTRFLEGEHFVAEVKSWSDFTEAVAAIVKGGHQFKTVVLDTIDDIYKFADARAGANHKKLAAGLVEYGKGTTEAEALFRQEIGKLLASPLGIWFIGHMDTEQIANESKYIPKLDKRVRTFVEGNSDFNWFAHRIGKRAQLQTQPTALYAAGSRVPMPDPCPLDAKTIYRAMQQGFNGKPAQTPAEQKTEPEKVAA